MVQRQRKVWFGLLPDVPRNLLYRIDIQAFASYVELIVRHRDAVLMQRQPDRNSQLPLIIKTRQGHVISPYVRIIDRCVLLMRALQQEFGFTPSARARIIMADASSEPADEWGQLYQLRVLPGGKNA